MRCVCLILTPMEATTISWAIMIYPLLIQTMLIILHYRHIMTCEPIDILWQYLILVTLLFELVIWNLNFKKGHTEFWGDLWCCTAPYM